MDMDEADLDFDRRIEMEEEMQAHTGHGASLLDMDIVGPPTYDAEGPEFLDEMYVDMPPLEDDWGNREYPPQHPLVSPQPGFQTVSPSLPTSSSSPHIAASSSAAPLSVRSIAATEIDSPSSVVSLPLQSTPSEPLSLSPRSVGEPCRKRLRGKQSVPVAANPVVPERAEGIWEGYFDIVWDGHRSKYFWVYNKFRHWINTRVKNMSSDEKNKGGKIYVEAGIKFKDVEPVTKHKLVQEFMNATAAPRELRRWAQVIWPMGLSVVEKKQRYFCYSRQVLWTWQGEWGLLSLTSIEKGASWRIVVLAIAVHPEFLQLWEEFRGFNLDWINKLGLVHWGMSAELCVETWVEKGIARVHLHAYWKSDSKMYVANAEQVLFKGSCPNKSYSIGGIHQRSTAGWAGMYYLACPKIGMIMFEASAPPFTGYPVSGDWPFSLVQAKKMETVDARAELIKVGKGLVRKLADLDKMVQLEKEERISKRVQHVQAVIAAKNLAFKKYPGIEEWRAVARQPFQRRKRFLVLEGPSGLGKTEFIKSLFGPARTLELNCANCGDYPNLRGHDADLHDCVLFDEGSMSMVLNNRKVFQAPACWIDFGHSPTGRDVYRVFLGDSVLVISTNKWSEEFAALTQESSRNWISQNQVLVNVTEPMFVR